MDAAARPKAVAGTESYREIFRSSSIMGGAHGINYLIGLVRVKIIAVILGPSGVGLISLYSSALGMVGAISSLGIGTSSVREVAQAHADGDSGRVARTVVILRRACWATGILGWVLASALAYPLSLWMFRSPGHAVTIAILGFTLLLGAIGGGQTAVLQGVRRIGDIARFNVASAFVNTALAVGIYAALGEQGIVPVLLSTAAVSAATSWWFVRRVGVEKVEVSWADTIIGARRLAGLGLAVMWSGLLTTGVDVATRSLIVREHGVDAAGLYQAAWALSGVFAGFILNAMGTDFYPRLAGAIHDREEATRIVNHQTEVGVMLALPGLLATVAFAPLLMEAFYSGEFLPAASLLPWFVVGIFGRVISFPMGYIALASGASRLYAATETAFLSIQLILVFWLVRSHGVIGAAYAFVITYFLVTFVMLRVGYQLIRFRWSPSAKRLLAISSAFVIAGIGATEGIPGWKGILAAAVVSLAGTVVAFRRLSSMLGSRHGVVRVLRRFSCTRWLVGREQ